MNEPAYLIPSEIAEAVILSGVKKTKQPSLNLFMLGILAGAFIAFASEGSTMAAFNLFTKPETIGLGKALAGSIFGTGLMFVIIAGGELFTGNSLLILGVLDKRISLKELLRNWFFVYLGNFVGSLLIAFLIIQSGQLTTGANGLGAITIKIAAAKVHLSFTSAFALGIMCNWLVCLAIWMAFAAKDITGKILAIFFPIWLFITSGFEHSIANMYYIPAGILAKADPVFTQAALSLGLRSELLAQLNWNTFFINNLIPVTLGNIVGGAVFVGGFYWFIYLRKANKKA